MNCVMCEKPVGDNPVNADSGWVCSSCADELWPNEPWTKTVREAILDAAKTAVLQDRAATYGGPEQSFNRIAAYWSILFGLDVEPWQVAQALALLKLARIDNSPRHRDNWVDIAGYAACGAELAEGPL